MMKKFFIAVLLFWGMFLAVAGQAVSGIVVDSQGMPLEYASVSLLQAGDSSYVSGCVTDEQGRFVVQGGNQSALLLKVSSVSYKTIVMKCSNPAVGLRLVLEDDVVEYANVIVKGKRPFTKNMGDKVVFNAQLLNNVDALQAIDLLNYVPGVMVSGASIFLGKEKWNVYANYSFGQSRSKSNSLTVNQFLYNNTVHSSDLDDVTLTKNHDYAVGTVVNITDDHQLSFEVNGTHTPRNSSVSSAREVLTLSDGSVHTADMASETPSKSDFYNVAGSYKWNIDTLGSSLKVLMNYNNKNTSDENRLVTVYQDFPSNNVNEME